LLCAGSKVAGLASEQYFKVVAAIEGAQSRASKKPAIGNFTVMAGGRQRGDGTYYSRAASPEKGFPESVTLTLIGDAAKYGHV
jgi:hypothetical protein